MKVRQPLPEAVIVADERERAVDRPPRGPRARRAEREAGLLRQRGGRARRLRGEAELPLARPALRVQDVELVTSAIEALDPTHVAAALDRGESVDVAVNGREESLGPDDLSLVMLPRGGYQLERQANYAVALRARPGRRAAPRGDRSRGRARDPERPQGRRPRGRGPDRAGAVGRRGPARRGRATTPTTSRARRWPRGSTLDGATPTDAHVETTRIEGSELGISLKRSGRSLISSISAAGGQLDIWRSFCRSCAASTS